MYVAAITNPWLKPMFARTPLTASHHSSLDKHPQGTVEDGREAALWKASLLAVVTDCATLVSNRNCRIIDNWLTVLGSIILCGIAILTSFFLLWKSERKKAAVGRRCAIGKQLANNRSLTRNREMQLFLIGYIIISICEIFTIGGFPLNNSVRLVRCSLQPRSNKS